MAVLFASDGAVQGVLLIPYFLSLSQAHGETVWEGYRTSDGKTDSLVHPVA